MVINKNIEKSGFFGRTWDHHWNAHEKCPNNVFIVENHLFYFHLYPLHTKHSFKQLNDIYPITNLTENSIYTCTNLMANLDVGKKWKLQ